MFKTKGTNKKFANHFPPLENCHGTKNQTEVSFMYCAIGATRPDAMPPGQSLKKVFATITKGVEWHTRQRRQQNRFRAQQRRM